MKIESDQKLNIDYVPDGSDQKPPNIDYVPGGGDLDLGETAKRHKCDICEKTFTSKQYLKSHKKLHTGELNFSCSQLQCDYKSAFKFALKRHERIHTGELPYVCDLCGKGYRCSENLKRHMANHSDKREFMCDLCNFATNKLYEFKRHSDSVHKGIKPVQCDDCGKAFSRTSALNRHKRLHTGENPYKCDECGESFRLSASLTKHKGKHKDQPDYICNICSKPFFDSFSFGMHKNWHLRRQNGEHLNKPKKKITKLSCEHCGERFRSKGALEGHMRSHTGEKPFEKEFFGADHPNQEFFGADHPNHPPKLQVLRSPDPPPPFIEPSLFNQSYTNPQSHPFHQFGSPMSSPSQDSGYATPLNPLTQHLSQDELKGLSKSNSNFAPNFNSLKPSTSNSVAQVAKPCPMSSIPCAEESVFDMTEPVDDSTDDKHVKNEEDATCKNEEDGEYHSGIQRNMDDIKVDFNFINGIIKMEYPEDKEYDNIKKEPIESDEHFNQQVMKFLYKEDSKEGMFEIKGETPNGKKLAHKDTDNSTKEHFCGECGYKTRFRGNLTKHVQNVHKKEPTYHTGRRPFKCNLCPKTFLNKKGLQNHMQSFHENTVFTCDDCGKTFSGEKNLQKHKKNAHSSERHMCDLCPKTYKCKPYLNDHLISAHGIRRQKQMETKTNGNTDNICEDCGKSYPSKKILKIHKINVHGLRSYTCDECGKTFKYPHSLKQHLLLHKGDKPFMCDHCSKTFITKDRLKTHLRNTHRVLPNGSYDENLEQTLLPCDECGKLLANANSLKEHKLLHSGVKPFICDQCSQTFVSKRRVRMHKSQYHKKSQILKSNICDICAMSFIRSYDLKRHMLTHTGERPHKCHICVMAFAKKGDLGQHILTHTGERPHKCDYCEMAFARKYLLNQHILKCHKIPDQPTSTGEGRTAETTSRIN